MGSAKGRKCTKALCELTNHCKKTIDKRNLIDHSVIKAAIFARSSSLHRVCFRNLWYFENCSCKICLTREYFFRINHIRSKTFTIGISEIFLVLIF